MRFLRVAVVVLGLLFTGCSKNSGKADPPDPPADNFAKGADISWITEMEWEDRKFYSKSGIESEGMALLKSLGMNTIRLRVWVNPSASWNSVDDVVTKAVRAKDLGLRVMINFHYSDDWADPGKQTKPAAWSTKSFSELKTAVAVHTGDVLSRLKTAGVTPEWVQVGNETNDGLLWPEGKASLHMANYAQLLSSGYDAIKSIFPSAKVIVHISNGWDNGLFRWNIGGLRANGAKFDVIGMSLYPTFVAGGWTTANQLCLANMNDMVSRYDKEVMVVETGMPWDEASACRSFLTDLITKTKSVQQKKGLGVLYWEPQCFGHWKGYTMGAFDNNGKPTVALDAFTD